MAERLFGTDGLRGTVNNYPMTVDVALRLGLAAGVFSIAGNYLGTRVFTAKGSRGVKPIMITVLGIFFIKLCYELFFAK